MPGARKNGLPFAVKSFDFLGVQFAVMDQSKIANVIFDRGKADVSSNSDLTITPFRIDTQTTNNPK